jgi:hypothetical protein
MRLVNLHQTWYTGTCENNGHELITIHVNFMVKCVCYMGLGSNGCFVTGATLMGSHYSTYIISSMGHPRSGSVGLLVLWTIVYNGWGGDIVLMSIGTMPTLLRRGNISGRPYY